MFDSKKERSAAIQQSLMNGGLLYPLHSSTPENRFNKTS